MGNNRSQQTTSNTRNSQISNPNSILGHNQGTDTNLLRINDPLRDKQAKTQIGLRPYLTQKLKLK